LTTFPAARRRIAGMEVDVKRALFALASLVLVGAVPALAQYAPPRPPGAIGPMAAEDVADIVQAMGLDPVGPPARSGAFYVQSATDDFGRVLRVTVDARRSQVIAIEAAAMRQRYGLHAGYGVYRRPYPGYAIAPDDDFDLAAPGSVMAPHGQHAQPPRMQPPHVVMPQPHAQPPRPVTKSAAVPPARAPVPRKRPAAAPEQAAAGSVEPVSPPKPAPAPVAAKPADPAPAKPAEPTLPPVAPLE
jgi:hypothetical protein